MGEPFHAGALDVPDRLVGARVVLHPFERADVPALRAAIEESREHLRPWLPWADGHRTPEETYAFAAKQKADRIGRAGFGCGIFLREDGRVLGGSGLHVRDWAARSFEIGYWLRVGATGHGYVREAVALLSRLAFERLGANRVVIRCDAENGCGGGQSGRAGRPATGHHGGTMREFLFLVVAVVRGALRSRGDLIAENLLLRQQLLDLTRPTRKRPRVRPLDRLFWVFVQSLRHDWRRHLVLVRPETVVGWHRRGWRLFWRWRSRVRSGRPRPSAEVRELIARIARDNPAWGAERIRGELLKLVIADTRRHHHRASPNHPRPTVPNDVQTAIPRRRSRTASRRAR